MDRREFVIGVGATAARLAIGPVMAALPAMAALDEFSAQARALYRRAIVLDGNCSPPAFSAFCASDGSTASACSNRSAVTKLSPAFWASLLAVSKMRAVSGAI